jgi:hypothetical protein
MGMSDQISQILRIVSDSVVITDQIQPAEMASRFQWDVRRDRNLPSDNEKASICDSEQEWAETAERNPFRQSNGLLGGETEG